MKAILYQLVILLLSSLSLFAQNKYLPYQGILKNDQGVGVPNKEIQLRMTIKTQANIVYQENQKVTTDKHGWFEVLIGSGTVSSGTFANVNWINDVNTLTIECSPDNNGNFEEIASKVIQGAPFSISGDQDPTNELQKLEQNGNTITLSKNGGSFLLPTPGNGGDN